MSRIPFNILRKRVSEGFESMRQSKTPSQLGTRYINLKRLAYIAFNNDFMVYAQLQEMLREMDFQFKQISDDMIGV